MEPTIVARNVEKSFGTGARRTSILHGVTMQVDRGEIVYLVGPSGSGKTTLLSLLGCLLTPDRGSVRVLGLEIGETSPKDLEVFRRDHLGFVFQTFNLFPTLSARDNVCLAFCMREMPLKEARRRATTLLEAVGLGHRAHLRPTKLSTGECQRVAIARALANEPAVLLADEPTASLDAENGQSVMRLLTRLAHEKGVTLLIVTHDNRIYPFANRILRLEDGRLIQAQEVTLASAEPAIAYSSSSSTAGPRARSKGHPDPEPA